MKFSARLLIALMIIFTVSISSADSCKNVIANLERVCLEDTTGPDGLIVKFRYRMVSGGVIGECILIYGGTEEVRSTNPIPCDGSVPSPTPNPIPQPTPTPPPVQPNPDKNPAPAPKTSTKPAKDNSVIECGSIILTDNQVLGEAIPVVGANFELAYFTNKVEGRTGDYIINIPLTASVYDPKFSHVMYSIKLNGSVVESKVLPISKNLSVDYVWNGATSGNSYGSGVAEISIEKIPGGKPFTYSVPVGSFRAKSLGLGAWVPTVYHYYDIARRQLLRGDGSSMSADYEVLDEKQIRVVDSERSVEYVFNSTNGRHLKTQSFIWGRELYSFQFDSNGYLTSITELFKVKTLFNRNGSGDLISITAPSSEVTLITLDSNKLLSSVTSPANQFFSLTYYDEKGLLKTFKKPMGQVSEFSYDSSGNLISDSHSGGYSINLEKTTSGSLTTISTKTQMGRVATSSEEDGVDKDGPFYQRVDRRADGTFNQLWTSDEFNITYSRDMSIKGKFNFSTTRTQPSKRFKNASTFWYNISSGTVTRNEFVRAEEWDADWGPFAVVKFSITDSLNGNKTTTNFISETKTLTTRTPRGTEIYTTIDDWERPVSIKLGNDLPTTLSYSNEKISRAVKGKHFLEYSYDPVSKRLISVRNPLSQKTQYIYDKAGRLASTEFPSGKKIVYEYDANNKLIGITPAHRPRHGFNFNSQELLVGYLPPMIDNETNTPLIYTYNDDKQIQSLVKSNGDQVVNSYDLKTGVLKATQTPEGVYLYKFNINSGLYDNVVTPSQLSSERVRVDNGFIEFDVLRMPDKYLGYYKAVPDIRGRIRMDGIGGLENTPKILLEYAYGVDDKIERVGDQQISYEVISGRTNATKTSAGANSITDSYKYDEYGQLKSYNVYNGKTVLYSLDLSYDLLGRIVKKVEALRGVSQSYDYSYDLGGRLVEVKLNGVVKSKYSYDLNDNRISGTVNGQPITAAYDDQDRIVSFNSESFSFNLNGEMASRNNKITSQKVQYKFDSFGKLISVQTGSNLIEYQMDGFGRRAINSVNGSVQNTYLYKDQIRLAGIVGSSGVALQSFGYSTKAHVPDIMVMNNESYRIITDQLGSVRLVVKASDGTIVQEMLHDEFGRVLKDTKPGFQPFGFAGGLYDSNTGLVQFGARWYDSQIGRWISKDPIKFDGGFNLYGYVGENPVNYIDPSGLDQEILRSSNGWGHETLHIFTPGVPDSDVYIDFGPARDVENYEFATNIPAVVSISKIRPKEVLVLEGSFKKTSVEKDKETIRRALEAANRAKSGSLKYNFLGGQIFNYTKDSKITNCRAFAEGLGK